jgi:hypothetical protein
MATRKSGPRARRPRRFERSRGIPSNAPSPVPGATLTLRMPCPPGSRCRPHCWQTALDALSSQPSWRGQAWRWCKRCGRGGKHGHGWPAGAGTSANERAAKMTKARNCGLSLAGPPARGEGLCVTYRIMPGLLPMPMTLGWLSLTCLTTFTSRRYSATTSQIGAPWTPSPTGAQPATL